MGFFKGLLGGNKFQSDVGTSAGDVRNQTQAVRDAIAQQQAFTTAAGGVGGLQNQQDVYNQLSGIAAGTGPNPAQAMLSQATGANVANQAALMAGQRGANANAGLMARQASQAGAGIQQQAAGQGATMQANQSLGAINQMGGIAGQQVGQQQQALANLGNQQQALQTGLMGGQAAQQGLAQQIAAQNQQQKMGIIKGITGAALKGAAMMADGGEVTPATSAVADVAGGKGPKSSVGKMFSAAPGLEQDSMDAASNFGEALTTGIGAMMRKAPTGNPGMQGAAPGARPMMTMAQGGNVGGALQSGGNVPGKPAIGGTTNSYSNDIVDAKLSPGEIVLPRSVTQSSDPVGNAAKFVAAIMAKQGMKSKGKSKK